MFFPDYLVILLIVNKRVIYFLFSTLQYVILAHARSNQLSIFRFRYICIEVQVNISHLASALN